MKFVHIADVHWGMSPDSDKPWSKERSQDIKDTFAKAVAQAGQLEADCLFISGDLFVVFVSGLFIPPPAAGKGFERS